MKKLTSFAGIAVLAALCGCASTDATGLPGGWRDLPMKDLMVEVIDPSANAFWSSSGEIDTGAGVATRTPENEARWAQALKAAGILQETGAFLA